MTFEAAMSLVRLMIDQGILAADAMTNPAIPGEFVDRIREALERDDNIILEPARILGAAPRRDEWLRQIDRSTWYYWPRLREYLFGVKQWPALSSAPWTR
jgi:hypothetical protein